MRWPRFAAGRNDAVAGRCRPGAERGPTATEGAGSLRQAIAACLAQGLDEQSALKRVARDRGVSKSEVYREWQREQGRRK